MTESIPGHDKWLDPPENEHHPDCEVDSDGGICTCEFIRQSEKDLEEERRSEARRERRDHAY